MIQASSFRKRPFFLSVSGTVRNYVDRTSSRPPHRQSARVRSATRLSRGLLSLSPEVLFGAFCSKQHVTCASFCSQIHTLRLSYSYTGFS